MKSIPLIWEVSDGLEELVPLVPTSSVDDQRFRAVWARSLRSARLRPIRGRCEASPDWTITNRERILPKTTRRGAARPLINSGLERPFL